MAKAPKSDQVTTPEEALMLAQILQEAGVAPERAAELVNNAVHLVPWTPFLPLPD
jgi:hypothetical protein